MLDIHRIQPFTVAVAWYNFVIIQGSALNWMNTSASMNYQVPILRTGILNVIAVILPPDFLISFFNKISENIPPTFSLFFTQEIKENVPNQCV